MNSIVEARDYAKQIIEIASFGGFIVFATLFIGLNRQAFDKMFTRKDKTYWLFFLFFTSIPFLIALLLFSYFFERFDFSQVFA